MRCTAEGAELLQVRLVELAGQVVDRVQHGRGVRLGGDFVVPVEVAEPQGGHDGDHRCRRRLVAADLHLARRAVVVGVVDHPDREPQHAALDLVEHTEVDIGVR
jgi:hypothetical protein